MHSPSFGDPRNSVGTDLAVRNRRGLSFIEGWIPKSVSSDGWWPPMIYGEFLAVWSCELTRLFGKDVEEQIHSEGFSLRKSTKNWTAFLVIFGATPVLGQPGLTWRCVGLSLGRAVSQRPDGHAAAAEGLAENRRHNRRIKKIF